MNRTELAVELARRIGVTERVARSAVDAIFSPVPGRGILIDRLIEGEKVVVTGFGTFFTRPARRAGPPGAKKSPSASGAGRRTAAFRCGLPLRDQFR